MTPALFFDRDGTLNEEVGHLVDLGCLRILAGAADAVAVARGAGFRTVLVTNQSGIARGLFDEAQACEANRRVAAACGPFDGIYLCPHHPRAGSGPWRQDCTCRKPKAGMLLRARDELAIDLARSWMIGDSAADLGAGRAAGCGAVLVRTGKGVETVAAGGGRDADHVAVDVLAAVRWIVAGARETVAEGADVD